MTTAFHTNPRFAEHTQAGHPEYAGRQTAILNRFSELELLERLLHTDPREVTEAEIRAAHRDSLIATLEKVAGFSHPAMIGLDTYALPVSYEIARLAAGGLLNVVDAVLEGRADNGLAIIRPPGHHATPNRPMGFCLLNNIAIAARYARQRLVRVAIVDFDVHHGNGTQDIFYDDPSVLFISSHQSPLYPGTGDIDETGSGQGQGATINIPVRPNTGNSAYRALYQEVVVPALQRFQPELILVSAGFDAHWRDPLAHIQLSLTALADLTRLLITTAQELCGGRIIFVSEGGYDLEVLSNGMANVALALLGESTVHDPLGMGMDTVSVTALIQQLKRLHRL